MRFSYVLLAIVAAIAAAEQYAMIFGTADGWGNYSITSVICFLFLVMYRILAVFTPILSREVLSLRTSFT